MQQGLALHKHGKLNEAIALYRDLLDAKPEHAEALHMLGVAEFQRQNFDASAQAIARSISIDGRNAMSCFNLGNACRALGRIDDALLAYGNAIKLKPDYIEARVNRGLLAFEKGQWDTAAIDLSYVVQRKASDVLLVKLGLALHQLQRFDEAARCHTRATQLAPANAEAHCHLGSALLKLERRDEALACYDTAISLAPHYATAHFNRGALLSAAGALQQAADSYQCAIEADPAYIEARIQRGIVLGWLGYANAALAQFDQAITLAPSHAGAHFHKGLELLMDGDLEQGWMEYEWRLRDAELASGGVVHGIPRVAPEWQGEALDGSLLVLPEQGLGDQIFHAALLPEAREHAGKLVACVDARLIALLSRSMPGITFMSPVQVRDDVENGTLRFAAQIHAASLGKFFRAGAASLARVRMGYLLADRERSAVLRTTLHPADAPRLVCGVAWHSKNAQSGSKKGLDLHKLAAALDQTGMRFIDLQYGDTTADRESLKASTGVEVTHIDDIDNLTDIDGLAALIDACDLVVTVSNSTAHLAAALGKPVWVLLADGPGLFWFWHRQRADSPWYPTVRLLRQPLPGAWDPVVQTLRAELAYVAQPTSA